MPDRYECVDCIHFRMTHDISGYEAHCTANSAKGRMINWQYGMDMDWCRDTLMDNIREHKSPAWCPKAQPLPPCPVCGKAVEAKWVAGMDEKTAKATNHPLDGIAGWYIEYCPGEYVYESLKGESYEASAKARRKLIRAWKTVVKKVKELPMDMQREVMLSEGN